MVIIWLLQIKYFILTKNKKYLQGFSIISLLSSFNTSLFSFEYDDDTPQLMDILTSSMFHASPTLFCIEMQHISLCTTLIPSSLSCLPYSLLCIYKAYITLRTIFTSLFLSCLPYCLLRIDAAYITAFNFYLLIFILPPLLSYV